MPCVQVCVLFRQMIFKNKIFLLITISLALPNCGNYPDCNSCAKVPECAWCASEGTCTSISTAFTKDCGGLVFELPCPDSFVNGIFLLFQNFISLSN